MTLSLDTAYRSFGGEVEASSTPTICRLPDSRRHQLSAIAHGNLLQVARTQHRPWVGTYCPSLACCKPATWLRLDGGFAGRGRARIDRGGGPTGAGAAKFRRDVSSVRCSRPDSACHGRAQLDDRVGCSALLLGSCRLSRVVRSRGLSVNAPCMERGCAWDRHGPSVTRLNHGSSIEPAACSGFDWRSLVSDHSFSR